MRQQAGECSALRKVCPALCAIAHARKTVRCAIHKGLLGGPLESVVLHLPLGLNVAQEDSAVLGIPVCRLSISFGALKLMSANVCLSYY